MTRKVIDRRRAIVGPGHYLKLDCGHEVFDKTASARYKATKKCPFCFYAKPKAKEQAA